MMRVASHVSLVQNRKIRRGWSWSFGLLLFILTLAPLNMTAAPIVTIIDDDARSEKAVRAVKEVADRCGIKVTFAAIAAGLERDPKLAGLLRQYVEEGHEIASHSLTHSAGIWKAGDATDLRAIEHEVAEAEEVFSRLGFQPKSFVYPYGNFSRKARRGIFEIVGRYYPVAFNARGDMNLPGKTYPLYVSRHPLRSHNSLFMTKLLIDKAAAADASWVVILTHSANSDFSAERLESIIRYAQKSGAVFLPASVAWQQVVAWPMMSEEQIPDYSRIGDYVNAAYYHLPLLLGGGMAFIVLCGVPVFLYVRLRSRRKKRKAAC